MQGLVPIGTCQDANMTADRASRQGRDMHISGVVFGHAVEDGKDLVEGGGVDHRDAELFEGGQAFEVSAIVFAHLEHSGVLAFELDSGHQMSAAHLHTLGHSDFAFLLAPQQALGLLEYPGVADCPAAYENAIHTIAATGFHGLLWSGDVAVAENRDMHAGIVFYLADEGPVGGALIHLGLGASVYAEGGNADVLQPFGQFHNGFVVGIIAQTGFDGDGQMGPPHKGLGDAEHLGYVLQYAAARPFASHLAHRAAPVDVDKVGLTRLHYVEALQQFVLVGTEYLYAYGVLLGGETHFAVALFGFAVQGLGGDEFGDKQVGTEPLAQLAEGLVGDVVHGRKSKDTIFSEIQRFSVHDAKIQKKRRTDAPKCLNRRFFYRNGLYLPGLDTIIVGLAFRFGRCVIGNERDWASICLMQSRHATGYSGPGKLPSNSPTADDIPSNRPRCVTNAEGKGQSVPKGRDKIESLHEQQ